MVRNRTLSAAHRAFQSIEERNALQFSSFIQVIFMNYVKNLLI